MKPRGNSIHLQKKPTVSGLIAIGLIYVTVLALTIISMFCASSQPRLKQRFNFL